VCHGTRIDVVVYVAVHCNVLQCVSDGTCRAAACVYHGICIRVAVHVAMCCSALQCVNGCVLDLQQPFCRAMRHDVSFCVVVCVTVCCSTVCCSVLQCVAAHCSLARRVVVCFIILQHIDGAYLAAAYVLLHLRCIAL